MIHLKVTIIFCLLLLEANGMIGWMVNNSVSMKANVVLKIYKTLIRPNIEYSSQAWASVLRHGNWRVILRLNSIIKKSDKIIKRVKCHSYWKREN